MSSVSLNGAEQKLVFALNYSQTCSLKGALGKVHKFGHDWIESRENYGNALINGITGLIHYLASSIFHSMWSLLAGRCFVDKEPREYAGKCWKEVGKHLLVIIKGIAGIAEPSFGKWIDKKFLPTVPKGPKISEEEVVGISEEAHDIPEETHDIPEEDEGGSEDSLQD